MRREAYMARQARGNGIAIFGIQTKRKGLACVLVALLMCLAALCGCAQTSVRVTESSGSQLDTKASVNDYSWDELAGISDAIAGAESDDEALKIAESYHLCSAEGKLDGSQQKQFTLADGTQVAAQIIGFRHDDKADGSGKAGLTFLLTAPLDFRAANGNGSTDGGWEQSEMRAWLGSEGLNLFPADLQAHMKAVQKMTNNTGAVDGAQAATATQDTLWLLSAVEITGPVEAGTIEDDEDGALTALYNAEGSRYQLYEDTDVDCGRATSKKYDIGTLNEVLVRKNGEDPCMWWERSVHDGSATDFYCVMHGGSPIGDAGAAYEHGLVPAFCL